MPPLNQIALVPALKKPFQIVSAPYTSPKENRIVVKSAAIAINPIDFELQDEGKKIFPNVTFPLALGFDVAGEVVEIGSRVVQFKVGDRVVGVALGSFQTVNDSTQSAFQLHVVLADHMAAKIPDNISYEKASVMPLGFNTAAAALFDPSHLNLSLPSPIKQKSMAVSAGYEVFTTCSPRNFALVQSLGAFRVFDYRSSTVIQDIISAYAKKPTAGALAIGIGSMDAVFEILNKVEQGNKSIAMATFPIPEQKPKFLTGLYVLWYITTSLISYTIVQDDTLRNGIGKAIWQDHVGDALANGTLVPHPEPLAVGTGLDKIQEGIDVLKRGVSARKIVVLL